MPGPIAFRPPSALLSCQHFLHSSVDIPASRACVRNAVIGEGPAQRPPALNRSPHPTPCSQLAPPPEFPLAPSSKLQNTRARRTLQETEGEALKGAGIKMHQPPTWGLRQRPILRGLDPTSGATRSDAPDSDSAPGKSHASLGLCLLSPDSMGVPVIKERVAGGGPPSKGRSVSCYV